MEPSPDDARLPKDLAAFHTEIAKLELDLGIG